jgi:S1-C subfamily serine protease
VAAAVSAIPAFAQQTQATPSANEIFDRTKTATVVILAGEGGGRLRSVATGVLVSKDGVVFTALHAIKGALEVQVRTANGEVFDRVQRLGFDERRDVVALRIPANGLSTLNAVSNAAPSQGDRVLRSDQRGRLNMDGH